MMGVGILLQIRGGVPDGNGGDAFVRWRTQRELRKRYEFAGEPRAGQPARCRAVARFEFSNRGVIPSEAPFQTEGGISLKIVPGEIPPAAELRRGSG